MKRTENTEGKSYTVWGALGLAAGCLVYVLSGKVWFLIGGILAITFAMIFED